MDCDVCGAVDVRTEFCEACGVDFCEDCALGAHDMMHELTTEAHAQAEREAW